MMGGANPADMQGMLPPGMGIPGAKNARRKH